MGRWNGNPHERFRLQDFISVTTTPPVSGTKYTILDVRDVRVIGIAVAVGWTVQPTPLEVHADIDGRTWLFAITNPVSGTYYHCIFNAALAQLGQWLSTAAPSPFFVDCSAIHAEGETTGGTVQNLYAKAIYAKKIGG